MQFLVTLVRHGETFMNSQKLVQGHSDAALSEIGEEQAKALGRAVCNTKFTESYSSDLQRAYNTAQLILGQLNTSTPEVIKDERLRERGFGDAEGKPVKELGERAAQANVNVNDFIPPGGESNENLSKRAVDVFDELCDQIKSATSEKNVLVVSHGGWIIGLMRYLNSENNSKYELKNFSPSKAIRIHGNTGVTLLSITPNNNGATEGSSSKYVIEFLKINDVGHLTSKDG